MQAAQLGQNFQTGARGAADQFNRFVEGPDDAAAAAAARRRQATAGGGSGGAEPEHKDFWDDFAELGAEKSAAPGAGHRRGASKSNAIGTTAMKSPGGPVGGSASGSGASGGAGAGAGGKGHGQEEGWDDDW